MRSPPTTIANRSLTLVPVGPVIERVLERRQRHAASGARAARARRSRPAAGGALDGLPVDDRAGVVGAAVGAVGVEEDGGDRGALELERGRDRGLLVGPARRRTCPRGASVTVLSPPQPISTVPGANGAPRSALSRARLASSLPTWRASPSSVGRDDHRRAAPSALRLERHRLAGGRAGDQQHGLDLEPESGRATRAAAVCRCSRIDRRGPVPEAVPVEDRDRVGGARAVGDGRVGDRVDVVAGDVGDGQVDQPRRRERRPRAGRP